MSQHKHARTLTVVERPDARQVVEDGVEWTVFESRIGQSDRRSTPDLIFEMDSAMRRVRDYPPDWRGLADDALMRVAAGR